MEPAQETRLLELLYDRMYDAVTHSPKESGGPAAFPPNIYFQMAKNLVIDSAEFADMLSPVNPGGDQLSAELFSDMVDQIPSPGPLWSASGGKVSNVVANAFVNANAIVREPNPRKEKAYKDAMDFLQVTTEFRGPGGEVRSKTDPSPAVIAYEEAQGEYIAAVSGYRTAFNGYDLTDKKDQREWNAVAPMLQNQLTRTWNAWGRAYRADVEEAQQILASSKNEAVSYAITRQKVALSESHWLPSSVTGKGDWLPSYAIPGKWAAPNAISGTKIRIKSSDERSSSSASAHTYGLQARGRYGLFHASGGAEGEVKKERSHLDAQNLTISADLLAVQIMRPWFDPTLLSMTGWTVNGVARGGISGGNPAQPSGMLPLLPTGFVIARNVEISGDFSNEDQEFISSLLQTSVEAGWGPFSLKAKYGHSITEKKMSANMTGGTLSVPGTQILAWINTVPPLSPSDEEPSGK